MTTNNVNTAKVRSMLKPEIYNLRSYQKIARNPDLVSELVAGHPQNYKPLGGVALLELIHLGVIPGGCASERRHVLNQHNFAFQAGEVKRLPRYQLHREVIDALCCCHHAAEKLNQVGALQRFIPPAGAGVGGAGGWP